MLNLSKFEERKIKVLDCKEENGVTILELRDSRQARAYMTALDYEYIVAKGRVVAFL